MRAFLIVLALMLTACSSPIERSYDEKVAEAKAACIARGGDEIRPAGLSSWAAVIMLGRPRALACIRYGKRINRRVAVYVFHADGDRVRLEVR